MKKTQLWQVIRTTPYHRNSAVQPISLCVHPSKEKAEKWIEENLLEECKHNTYKALPIDYYHK